MAYLDALVPPAEDQDAGLESLFPWMKRAGATPPFFPEASQPPASPAPPSTPRTPSTTPVFNAPVPWPDRPPTAATAPPATPPAAHPAVVSPGTPPTAPVTLGPTAGNVEGAADLGTGAAAQPVTLGAPARPTPAADALAASKPPDLHGWKKVLDVIGQARFPGIEAVIPGSPGNYRQQVRPLLEKRAAEEAKATTADLTGRKDEAQIARDQAEAGHLNQETEDLKNPKAKTKAIIIAGPNGEPMPALQDLQTDKIIDQNGNPIPNAKVWEKPPTKEEQAFGHTIEDLKREMGTNPAKYPGGYMEGAAGFKNLKAAALALDAEEAAAKRGPKDTSDKDATRADKNYEFNVKELDQERKPLEDTMRRISAGMSNLNLNSAQADAFLAPQILTLAAGGAGSGLRMNEAEISRILAGRTTWETLKASANKYSLDPQHVQIPADQRAAMSDILKVAQQKGTLKSSILEWADGALINTDDAKQQRQVVAAARKLMNAVDEGKRVQRNKTTGEFRVAPGE